MGPGLCSGISKTMAFQNNPLGFGASQGLATQGFGSPLASQETGRRPRGEDKQTCIPVTVRIVHDAASELSDDILIHGTEAGMLLLVGIAENLVSGPASLEFTLNDATGRIKV